jgi:hypothetical protein
MKKICHSVPNHPHLRVSEFLLKSEIGRPKAKYIVRVRAPSAHFIFLNFNRCTRCLLYFFFIKFIGSQKNHKDSHG